LKFLEINNLFIKLDMNKGNKQHKLDKKKLNSLKNIPAFQLINKNLVIIVLKLNSNSRKTNLNYREILNIMNPKYLKIKNNQKKVKLNNLLINKV